jgi:hypothetical protein
MDYPSYQYNQGDPPATIFDGPVDKLSYLVTWPLGKDVAGAIVNQSQ